MPFKDEIRYLAGLKQQIWQKMILLVQHIALMPTLKFLVQTVPEILRGSQNSKSRSRDNSRPLWPNISFLSLGGQSACQIWSF